MPEVKVKDIVVFEDLINDLQELRGAVESYGRELRIWIARTTESFSQELHEAEATREEMTVREETMLDGLDLLEEQSFTVSWEEQECGYARSQRSKERTDAWAEGARTARRRCAKLAELLSHSIDEAQASIDDRVFAGLSILQEAGSRLAEYVSGQIPPPLPKPVRKDSHPSWDFATDTDPEARNEGVAGNPGSPPHPTAEKDVHEDGDQECTP